MCQDNACESWDLFLSLQQSGQSLSGTARARRRTACPSADDIIGEEDFFVLSGTTTGMDVVMNAREGDFELNLNGIVSGNGMSGTFTASDDGCTFGNWSVVRQ
ncbi:MAG: hypothetical protein E2P02_31230 [Acidobacteria bacterium]|nr:MAG: hypothetical protein E2P02_31230 [Acidobacteriota bacterium]